MSKIVFHSLRAISAPGARLTRVNFCGVPASLPCRPSGAIGRDSANPSTTSSFTSASRAARRPAHLPDAGFRSFPPSAMGAARESADPTAAAKQYLRTHIKAALRKLTKERMAADSEAVCRHVLASTCLARAQHVGFYLSCAKLREVGTEPLERFLLAEGRAGSATPAAYIPIVDGGASHEMRLLRILPGEAIEATGPFGIREPQHDPPGGGPRENLADLDEPLDVLFMPGLGFDRSGHRLGRGGGYYDAFLEGALARAKEKGWPAPLLVALAFPEQVVDEIPVTAHDAGVDVIVLPDGPVFCTEAGRERW
ncbi:unnamed protein product [Pedinophyceae sp. YPF-701]|nr:unnamed protein product [Pedinophyceae sp. YPF-701]